LEDFNVDHQPALRRDILAQQPDFVTEGVSALETAVYRLSKR
jgi:hypothetical protein